MIRSKKDAIKFLRDYVRGKTYTEGFTFSKSFQGYNLLGKDPKASFERLVTLFEKNNSIRYHIDGEFRSMKHTLADPVKWVFRHRKEINKNL